jgi:DNA-binding Lrp family transcriptional regulator
MNIAAIVLIKSAPAAISTLAAEVAGLNGVSEAHSVAGSDVDVVAIVKVPDHESIATVVTEGIAKLDGVLDTTTMIAFRSYSEADLDAVYEGFGD